VIERNRIGQTTRTSKSTLGAQKKVGIRQTVRGEGGNEQVGRIEVRIAKGGMLPRRTRIVAE